jgi:hypothetical protein
MPPPPRLPRALFFADRVEHSDLPLQVVEGQLPPDLGGHLFFAGLAGTLDSAGLPLKRGNDQSYFGSDGYLIRVDLAGGAPKLTTRLAKPADYYADLGSHDARGVLNGIRQFATHGVIRISLTLGQRDLLNTAFLPMPRKNAGPQDLTRMLVTYDAGRPWELDLEELAVKTAVGYRDEWQAEALRGQPFPTVFTTAHPMWDPETETFFGVNWGKGIGQLLRMVPLLSNLDGLSRDARHRAADLVGSLGQERLAVWLRRLDGVSGRTAALLDRLLPTPLQGWVPQEFLHLVRWDGAGELESWLVVDERGGVIPIRESVHQLGMTDTHLVLLDTSFKVGIDQLFSKPSPGLPRLDGLLRALTALPMNPTATFHFIDRAELTGGAALGRGDPGSSKMPTVTARTVRLPRPAVHFLADYETEVDASTGRRRITLHVPHAGTVDVAEWIRGYDTIAWSKARTGSTQTPEPTIRGINVGGSDLNHYARYRFDPDLGTLLESHVAAEDPWSWGLALYAARDVYTNAPPPRKVDTLYYSAAGYWTEQLSTFIRDLYDDYPLRSVPLEGVEALYDEGDRPATLFAIQTSTLRRIDGYEVPKAAITFSPQFIPRVDGSGVPIPGGDRDGYVAMMAWTDSRAELWIFDAGDLARGPVCKLAAPGFVTSLTVHTAWLPTIGPRAATYDVDVRRDYGPSLRFRSRAVKDLFERWVYPPFEGGQAEKTEAEVLGRTP